MSNNQQDDGIRLTQVNAIIRKAICERIVARLDALYPLNKERRKGSRRSAKRDAAALEAICGASIAVDVVTGTENNLTTLAMLVSVRGAEELERIAKEKVA